MNTVSLREIGRVLADHPWSSSIDVLTDDIAEIAEKKPIFEDVGPNLWRATVEERSFALKQLDAGVMRVRLEQPAPAAANAAVGAILGALSGAAVTHVTGRRDAPELVLGLLLGGALGAVTGAAVTQDAPRAILTMRYEPGAGWQVYRGPYVRWAKARLGRQAG